MNQDIRPRVKELTESESDPLLMDLARHVSSVPFTTTLADHLRRGCCIELRVRAEAAIAFPITSSF